MNRIKLTSVAALVISLLIVGCQGKKKDEQIRQLKDEKEELTATIENKDSTINHLMNVMDEIEISLRDMAKRQKAVEKVMVDEELPKGVQDYIREINNILGIKDEKYESMRRQFSYAKYRISQLKTHVDSLDTLVTESKERIREFENQVMALQDSIAKRNETLNRLRNKYASQEKVVHKMDSMAHQAHYYINTEKTLLEQEILVKTGGFLGFLGQVEVMNPGFPKEPFIDVDVREKTTFMVPAGMNKVQLKTPHPKASYTLEENGADSTTLVIQDKEAFWEITEYMLVSMR